MPPPLDPPVGTDGIIDDFEITTENVKYQLVNLDASKAAGPDDIPAVVLKMCADALAKPLKLIYQKTLVEGKLPREWKLANIRPIFKKGAKRRPGNYRPVSLTSQACKVLERLIREQVMSHLEKNDLISEHQHGFVKKRSCLTNLLEAMDKWTEIVDSGTPVDIIYCDYKKAFDTVPHKRLLRKLSAYGIKGRILGWIQDFLSDRWQQVVINESRSSAVQVSSGVPQGSVLGPILFIIYINELPSLVNSTMKMFADDTKIFRKVEHTRDVQALQADLDKLSDWCQDWILEFNIEKCKVMHIGAANMKETYCMKLTNKEKQNLQSTEVQRDLGVYVSTELNATPHCQAAAKRASHALRQLKMAFPTLRESNFKALYTTYVRPHIEYGIQAIGPFFRKDIKLLECIQRRATKLVRSIAHLSYPERLERLEMTSVEARLKRGDLIEVYKILTEKMAVNYHQFFKLSQDLRTRGHHLKLEKRRSNSQARAQFFSNRIVSPWNQLPEYVVSAPTTNAFKNRLDQHLASAA